MVTAYVLHCVPPRLDTLGRRKRNSHAHPIGRPLGLAVGVMHQRVFDWRVTVLPDAEGLVFRDRAYDYGALLRS